MGVASIFQEQMSRKYWYHCTAVFGDTVVNSTACLTLVLCAQKYIRPKNLAIGRCMPSRNVPVCSCCFFLHPGQRRV